jgi:hypothetical protein
LPNVKNATSYFENGLKNRFRAIAIRAVHHFPSLLLLLLLNYLSRGLRLFIIIASFKRKFPFTPLTMIYS